MMKSERMRQNRRWFQTFEPSCRNGNPCVLQQWSIVRLKGRRFITWEGKANIRILGRNIWIDICAKVIHMLERCNSLVVSAYLLEAPLRESRKWSINPSKNSHSKTLHFIHTVLLCVPYDSSNKQQLFPYAALSSFLCNGDAMCRLVGGNF
jgi:hypothetical protein